jgi:hypothetical protein
LDLYFLIGPVSRIFPYKKDFKFFVSKDFDRVCYLNPNGSRIVVTTKAAFNSGRNANQE